MRIGQEKIDWIGIRIYATFSEVCRSHLIKAVNKTKGWRKPNSGKQGPDLSKLMNWIPIIIPIIIGFVHVRHISYGFTHRVPFLLSHHELSSRTLQSVSNFFRLTLQIRVSLIRIQIVKTIYQSPKRRNFYSHSFFYWLVICFYMEFEKND